MQIVPNSSSSAAVAQTHLAKSREPIYFRAHCIVWLLLSTTSSTTTSVLDMDKLRLPSLEDSSNSVVAHRPWTYVYIGAPEEGCRGLVRGAEKFDALKGFKFSTYAYWWIKQVVRKFVIYQYRTIHLPTSFLPVFNSSPL